MKLSYKSLLISIAFLFLISFSYLFFEGFNNINEISIVLISNIVNHLLLYQDSIKIFLISFLISLVLLRLKVNIYNFFIILGMFTLLYFGFYKFVFFLIIFILNSSPIFYFFFKDVSISFFNLKKIIFSICLYILLLNIFIFFPINNFYIYAIVLFVPFILSYKFFYKFINIYNLKEKSSKFFISYDKQSIIDVLIISTLSIYFFAGLMPEVGYDALATHLFIPSYLSKYQIWHFDVNSYIWAVFPLGGEIFYSFIYILAGEQSSKLSLFLILLIVLSILKFTCNKINITYKPLLLLTLSTPLIYLASTSMFIDLFWLMSGLMVIGLLFNMISDEKISNDNLILFFFTSALFINTKLIALIYIFPLYIFFFYLLFFKNNFMQLVNKMTPLQNLLIIISIIWSLNPFLTSYWHTNNPVFPFFNSIFQSDLIPLTNWTNSIFSNFVDYKILYNITFNTSKYLEAGIGAPGFFWIILFFPMSVKILFRKYDYISSLFIYGIFTFLTVFYFQSYLRYVLPSFIIFYVVFQKAFHESLIKKDLFNFSFYKFSYYALFVCIVLNLLFLNSASTSNGRISLNILTDEADYDNYMFHYQPIKKLNSIIKDKYEYLIEDQNILLLSNPALAHSPVKPIIINWYNAKAYTLFFKSLEREELFKEFSKTYDFSLIIYQEHIFMSYLRNNPNKNQLLNNFLSFTNEIEDLGSTTLRVVNLKKIKS